MKKRVLTFILTFIVCLCLVPLTALAAKDEGRWPGSLSIGGAVVVENGALVGELPAGMSWDGSGNLTLENLDYNTEDQALSATNSLTLVVKGENKLVAKHGVEVVAGQLRIIGDGSLDLSLPHGTMEEAFFGLNANQIYVLDEVTLDVSVTGGHRSFAIYCQSAYCQLRGDVSARVSGAERGFGVFGDSGAQLAFLGGKLDAEVDEGIAIIAAGLAADRGKYDPLVPGKLMTIAAGGAIVAGPDYDSEGYSDRIYDHTFSLSGKLTVDPETAITSGCSTKVSLVESPPTQLAVVPTNQAFTVNGAAHQMEIYNIDGNNYFKLRDVAYVLQNTSAGFAVNYAADLRAMEVYTGQAYAPVGGECAPGTDKSDSVSFSRQSFLVNDRYLAMTAFNIGGNNFFRLRDLGQILGFDVDYDNEARAILVTTD